MQDHSESTGDGGHPKHSVEGCMEGAAGHSTENHSHKTGIATVAGKLQGTVGGTGTGLAGTCCRTGQRERTVSDWYLVTRKIFCFCKVEDVTFWDVMTYRLVDSLLSYNGDGSSIFLHMLVSEKVHVIS